MYRRHFLLFAGISALLAIPSAASTGFNYFAAFGSLFQTSAPSFDNATYIESQLGQLAALLINVALLPFTYGAVTYAACESALGRPVTAGGIFRAVGRRYFPLLGLVLLVILMAVVFCLIPLWVWIWVNWVAVLPVMFVENIGLGRAMSRSWDLVRGRWWRTFLVVFLLVILSWFVGAALGAVRRRAHRGPFLVHVVVRAPRVGGRGQHPGRRLDPSGVSDRNRPHLFRPSSPARGTRPVSDGSRPGRTARHAMTRRRLAWCIAACALGAAIVNATAISAIADPAPPPPYAEAVQRAYDLIQNAPPQESSPAVAAVGVLRDGTGDTQPEIIGDLNARPPLYDDAKARLRALLAALQQPMTTADPALAAQKLHDVMSMSRYDALHRPPSLLDRFTQWVQDRISDLLRLLFGNTAGAPGARCGGTTSWASRCSPRSSSSWSERRAAASQNREACPAADRGRLPTSSPRPIASPQQATGSAPCVLFARGSRQRWRGSGRGRAARSRCARSSCARRTSRTCARLLVPFEAAVYGGREVDVATYERAARVAASFRQPTEVAA